MVAVGAPPGSLDAVRGAMVRGGFECLPFRVDRQGLQRVKPSEKVTLDSIVETSKR